MLKDRKNNDPNAAVDVIARAEDASKIQRITERFKLATVNRADVSLSIQKEKEKMFPKETSVKEALNPSLAKTDRDHLSEPNSMRTDPSTGYRGRRTDKPSVREKLEVYKAEVARSRAEKARQLARTMVSRGMEAAGTAARSASEPGRER